MSYKILEISIFHKYYRDQYLQNSSIEIDEKTKKLLQAYSIITKQENGYIALYYLGNADAESIIQAISDITNSLQFYIHYYGINIVHISDLPVNWCGHISYTVDKHGTLNRKLCDTPLGDTSTIGKITISMELIQNIDNSSFVINMDNRYTYWRYYIINKSNNNYNQLNIDNSDNIVFENKGAVKITNTAEAQLFEAINKPLPLKEFSTYRFSIVDSKKSSLSQKIRQKTILKDISVANGNNFTLCKENIDNKVYSDMYIYI